MTTFDGMQLLISSWKNRTSAEHWQSSPDGDHGDVVGLRRPAVTAINREFTVPIISLDGGAAASWRTSTDGRR